MAISADRLISGIKRRAIVPSSQSLFSDSDLLAFSDDIISSKVIPLIESVEQEYFVRLEETLLVASQSSYSIPYRALGRSLRELKLRDTANNIWNLAKLPLEDVQFSNVTGTPNSFYFLGDKVVLVPDVASTLSSSYYLMLYYRLPPSKLTTLSNCLVIDSVADLNTVFIADTDISSSFSVGESVDFVQTRSGNEIYSFDIEIETVSPGAVGTFINFTSDFSSSVSAGDYIALSGYSPFVNFVPNEAYSFLETSVCRRILSSLGDYEISDRLQQEADEEEKRLKIMLEPRIDGEPTVILDRSSLARGNKFSQRRFLFSV